MKSSLPFYALIVVTLLTGCSPTSEPQVGQAETGKRSVDAVAPRQRAEVADKDAAVAPQAVAPSTPAPLLAAPPPPPSEAKMNRAAATSTIAAPVVSTFAGAAAPSPGLDQLRAASEPTDRENYAHQEENPVKTRRRTAGFDLQH
ncbi:MAG: hypothetical protein HC889_18850 [Synechococcaceae cyanobacterium SM1_2_3]|nr:hypothetical protein [Synechococcaceae cyanobacterium SM1_2_3]